MILGCGGVNGQFKYNLHSYFEKILEVRRVP